MKKKIAALSAAILIQSTIWAGEMQLWLIQEEFVKFGKKDVYEQQQETWLKGFQKSLSKKGFWKSNSDFWPVYGLQASDEPQYIYLIPLKGSGAMGDYISKKNEYNDQLSQSLDQQRQILLSCLNFSIVSLHEFIPDCSNVLSDDLSSWQKNPYVHYWVFGITPGNDRAFEDHVKTMASEHKSSKMDISWRTWKVLMGADIPKYVVVLCAETSELLIEKIKKVQFIDPSMKDIVRNQREGDATLKQNLSITK
jgi:hypothetical protein